MIGKSIQTPIRTLACTITLATICNCGGSNSNGFNDYDAGGDGNASPNSDAPDDSQPTTNTDASQDHQEPFEGEPYVFREISLGNGHTVARTSDGTVMRWGTQYLYEYPDEHASHLNEVVSSSIPMPVIGLSSGTIAISAGGSHACAIEANGRVLCWGRNESAQLGDGLRNDSSIPHQVVGLDSGFVALSSAFNQTCALSEGGDVWCWGFNLSIQFRNPAHAYQRIPIQVHNFGPNVRALASGFDRTCAITSNGAAMCGGSNKNGELGDGTTERRSEPVTVLGLEAGVKAICAGFYHSCAITSEDGVVCWGSTNAATALYGSGLPSWQPTPMPAEGLETGVNAISCGSFHTCAITANGEAHCWGANGGLLGDGTTTNRAIPTKVVGLNSPVRAIAAGPGVTCAITEQDETYCWGANSGGQLGDATVTTRLTPTKVYGTP